MKALYLTLFTFLFLVSMAQAQVLNGNGNLTSQAEVDAFNYTEVTGFLVIQGADITSLQSLSSLTSVGNFLTITSNPSLTNLDGLSSLTSVGTDLIINFNPSLTEFCGLFALLNGGGLTGSYAVSNNAANPTKQEIIDGGLCLLNITLTSQAEVDAFNYTEVTGFILIEGADITSLQSLSTLTSVGGILNISTNPSLTNLDGLSNLTSVGYLYLQNNDALTSIVGLSSLTSVGGGLAILSNSALTNLDGLSNLTSVGGGLGIELNPSLTEFCGLFVLLYGGGLTGDYYVSDNAENPSAFEIVAEGPCFITPQYIPYALVKAIGDVQNLPLSANNKNQLISKLNSALQKYNQGNLKGAKNNLNNFLSQLNSFVKKGLIAWADAHPVIDYVHQIIDAINSSLPKAENESNKQLPEEFTLHQNYPNPFNPSTVINYQLPVGGHVSLKIYDILGNEVAILVNENKDAGYYEARFDGSPLSTGIYIYRLTAGNFISTKKMLMIK